MQDTDEAYGSPQLFGGYSNNFNIVRLTAKRTEDNFHRHMIIELNNFNGVKEYLLSDIHNDCRYDLFIKIPGFVLESKELLIRRRFRNLYKKEDFTIYLLSCFINFLIEQSFPAAIGKIYFFLFPLFR